MNMNDLQRSAIVATLIKECRARKAFCGETMVQKSVFVLQELLDVPLKFDFALYIYGPFSFELQQHLWSMMADDMLVVRPMEYGSTFETGASPDFLGLTGDSTRQHWIVIAELGHDPFNGWLYRGRLVPLINVTGLNDPGFEAW